MNFDLLKKSFQWLNQNYGKKPFGKEDFMSAQLVQHKQMLSKIIF